MRKQPPNTPPLSVPFNELKSIHFPLKVRLKKIFSEVLDSGHYILGSGVKEFENSLAGYLGVKFCVGVASGTDAITLGLLALGLKRGDEVIAPDVTAYPTIVGILNAGGVPVTADVDPQTGLIDPDQIKKNLSEKTRILLPVHLYGNPCSMRIIAGLAIKYNLRVLEDCAQSLGSHIKGKKTGSLGDIGSFSFYPTKNLGALGDGGAISTNDQVLYERLLSLRNYGQKTRYHHDEHGFNSRLDEIQAKILTLKLKSLDDWNKKRNQISEWYRAGLPEEVLLKSTKLHYSNDHLFVIKVKERDKLMSYLLEKGIQTLIHYPIPCSKQKAFTGKVGQLKNPCSEIFTSQILSLPIYPGLKFIQVQRIIKEVTRFLKG